MSSPSTPPVAFGQEFLDWLRSATEAKWSAQHPAELPFRSTGLDFANGTRWRGGLTDNEIDAVERRFGLTFPPDHRMYLATLHTTDPEMVGARYATSRLKGSRRVRSTGRMIYDWLGDPAPIWTALAWPIDGLLWSIEADRSWHSAWGPRPATTVGRETVVRGLAAAAPPLIPIYGHRYLIGAPLSAGNAILSMYGADVIFYGRHLAAYLTIELLGVSFPGGGGDPAAWVPDPVPFWQQVIDGLSRDDS